MAQATGRFGETFGIGSPDPGRAAGPVPSLVRRSAPVSPVHAFLVSTGLVALAEIGDKTQLLALMLAARFQRPWPIVAGILVATLANHAGAGIAGSLLGGFLGGGRLRWGVGLCFLAMAVWALIPDKYEADQRALSRGGAFVTTVVVFFLAEIGDKTQIATIGLAARFEQLYAVVIGTTLGMMLANIPAIILGDRLAGRLPLRAIRYTAALVFAALGIATIIVV
jgi:Ca2+/H+ antiporter, TMEM165/GDT1 family